MGKDGTCPVSRPIWTESVGPQSRRPGPGDLDTYCGVQGRVELFTACNMDTKVISSDSAVRLVPTPKPGPVTKLSGGSVQTNVNPSPLPPPRTHTVGTVKAVQNVPSTTVTREN